jgi:hypothetical protein
MRLVLIFGALFVALPIGLVVVGSVLADVPTSGFADAGNMLSP